MQEALGPGLAAFVISVLTSVPVQRAARTGCREPRPYGTVEHGVQYTCMVICTYAIDTSVSHTDASALLTNMPQLSTSLRHPEGPHQSSFYTRRPPGTPSASLSMPPGLELFPSGYSKALPRAVRTTSDAKGWAHVPTIHYAHARVANGGVDKPAWRRIHGTTAAKAEEKAAAALLDAAAAAGASAAAELQAQHFPHVASAHSEAISAIPGFEPIAHGSYSEAFVSLDMTAPPHDGARDMQYGMAVACCATTHPIPSPPPPDHTLRAMYLMPWRLRLPPFHASTAHGGAGVRICTHTFSYRLTPTSPLSALAPCLTTPSGAASSARAAQTTSCTVCQSHRSLLRSAPCALSASPRRPRPSQQTLRMPMPSSTPWASSPSECTVPSERVAKGVVVTTCKSQHRTHITRRVTVLHALPRPGVDTCGTRRRSTVAPRTRPAHPSLSISLPAHGHAHSVIALIACGATASPHSPNPDPPGPCSVPAAAPCTGPIPPLDEILFRVGTHHCAVRLSNFCRCFCAKRLLAAGISTPCFTLNSIARQFDFTTRRRLS